MARSRRAPAPAPARRPMTTRAAPAKPAPPPAPVAAAAAPPAVQQSSGGGGGGMLSGLGATIAQGMAFGTGSAIAHRAVGAVAESFSGGGGGDAAPAAAPVQQQQFSSNNTTDVCATDKTMFYDCLQQNKGDQQACHFLYEQLKDCQQNQMQFS